MHQINTYFGGWDHAWSCVALDIAWHYFKRGAQSMVGTTVRDRLAEFPHFSFLPKTSFNHAF